MTQPSREPCPLFTGRYLFHLHTSHTDGVADAATMLARAREIGAARVIFLEHIRREPSYDTAGFIAEVNAAGQALGLETHVGFEAKLLPDGALDIAPRDAARAAVLGMAEHGFPGEDDPWEDAVMRALDRDHRLPAATPRVWVHPGLHLKRHGLLEARKATYLALLRAARDRGWLIEHSPRYGLPPRDALDALRPQDVIHGLDAHHPRDLVAWWNDPAPVEDDESS